MSEECDEAKPPPVHHVQQELCTTRLPYRQGRKLTAVKVYTVNNESNHLLVFGVPSLNLRKELKSHFQKYGRVLQFNIITTYSAEQFTENYHCTYERIQSARHAKKALDTMNFYGGVLHVSYAPELELIQETRNKLSSRQRDVTRRLELLNNDNINETVTKELETKVDVDVPKLNMGEINTICIGKQMRDVVLKKRKLKQEPVIVIEKKFKPLYRNNDDDYNSSKNTPVNNASSSTNDVDIVDFTSTEQETLTNINYCFNYNKFGGEDVRKVEPKPVNKIKFNIGNKIT